MPTRRPGSTRQDLADRLRLSEPRGLPARLARVGPARSGRILGRFFGGILGGIFGGIVGGIAGFAMTALGLGSPCGAQDDRPSPNVILVMADDQGWGDVSHRGHPVLRTPNLDAMAGAGVRFDRFYAAAPVCSPTRGSCLTGRHPFRYGVFGANAGHLRAREVTLAEALKEHGYATGHFGKWHLGTLTRVGRDSNRGGDRNLDHYAPPWDHGFDTCFSTEAKVPTFDPMTTPPKWAGGVGKKKPGSPYGTAYWTGPEQRVTKNLEGDDSKLIMDRAIPFLESAATAKRPFLAVIWFHAPHLPVVAGPKYREPYDASLPEKTRHYYGCITALDEQVGRLRKKLRELGVAQNTMLWYCSDNGPEGRDGRAPGVAKPLRGRKRSLYEGGVRVPGILEWPAQVPSARRVSTPCSTSDYVPTVLAALGVKPRHPVDGINLLPVIAGTMKVRPDGIGFQSKQKVAWIEHRYKIVRDGRRKPLQLFDLLADPGETRDLAKKEPAVLARLSARLDAWRASCEESLAGKDYRK